LHGNLVHVSCGHVENDVFARALFDGECSGNGVCAGQLARVVRYADVISIDYANTVKGGRVTAPWWRAVAQDD